MRIKSVTEFSAVKLAERLNEVIEDLESQGFEDIEAAIITECTAFVSYE